MILASQKSVRNVPEAWFLSTVKKDDIKTLKMFYDISAMVWYGLWYHTTAGYHMYHDIPYHTGS